MNISNKLTTIRILCIPFFILLLIYSIITKKIKKWILIIFFIIICFTDILDGYIARKKHIVTSYGKFMDPLADKLLVCSILICLNNLCKISIFVTIVIIYREFIISGLRLLAISNNKIIIADYYGKLKTLLQIIMIIFIIIDLQNKIFQFLIQIIIIFSIILTNISLINYFLKNKKLFLK